MPQKQKNVPKGASPISGTKPPKKNQFGQKEGNMRSNGHWKKEDTLRAKIEKMVNEMTEEELQAVLLDPKAKLGEKRLAKLLLDDSIKPEAAWRILDGVLNQAYGYPKQQVEQHNIVIEPILPMEEE